MTELVTRTLIVKNRGRKYFSCVLNNHQAQLVIDDVTTDLDVDRIVTIEAEDLSTSSRYGTVLRFRATSILGDRSAAQARQAAAARKEAEKWLGFAETDLRRGLARTNAVRTAMELAAGHEQFTERLAALKATAQQVLAQEPAREAAHWLGLAETDVEHGLCRTRAVREALERAGAHEHLAGRLAALRERIGVATAAMPAPARRTLRAAAPQLGVPQMLGQRLVVFTRVVRQRRISDDDPSVFGAHLLGAEGDLGFEVEYRDADADEQAAFAAADAERKVDIEQRRAWRAEVDAIAAMICATGDQPDGPITLRSQHLCGGPTIYGGGEWFVVEPDGIWLVRNNGGDGDDWSRNNILTGGAGAIGWRVPVDAEMADKIAQLHNQKERYDR